MWRLQVKLFGLLASFSFLPLAGMANDATVVSAELRAIGGTWTVSVTLEHADTGWDDYADGWEVLDADGARLGFRELLHPHVNEQPFTRSLSGVTIPDNLTSVFIRARTNTDGWGDSMLEVSIP